jgi:hypothetical protein
MIFKIFSPKKSAKKLAFLTRNKAKLCKILIITLVFEKNAYFFRQKLSKIAENCDHNIDHRMGEFSPIGRLFYFGHFLWKNCRSSPNYGGFFHGYSCESVLRKYVLGYILGDFFHQLIWSPWTASKKKFRQDPFCSDVSLPTRPSL